MQKIRLHISSITQNAWHATLQFTFTIHYVCGAACSSVGLETLSVAPVAAVWVWFAGSSAVSAFEIVCCGVAGTSESDIEATRLLTLLSRLCSIDSFILFRCMSRQT